MIFAGLIGAITWNLITWYFGLPSSSSHALIGGVVGATFAAAGADAVLGDGILGKVLIPAVIAPVLAFVVGGIGIVVCYRIVGRQRPGPVTRGFRAGQVLSGGLLALAHGTNDAQKTMGVITLALIANGNLSSEGFEVPTWVIVSAASAIALGTYFGGWRIIKTMGTRIIKMDSAQGFSAQGAGAAVILASSHFGFPLSTTQVIAGRRDGRRRGQAALGRALGGGGQHRHRLAADAARRRRRSAPPPIGFTDLFPGALGPVLVTCAGLAGVAIAFAQAGSRRSSPWRRDRVDDRDGRRHQGALGDGRRRLRRRGRDDLRLLARDPRRGPLRRAQPRGPDPAIGAVRRPRGRSGCWPPPRRSSFGVIVMTREVGRPRPLPRGRVVSLAAMRALRNIAIIALLALIVVARPRRRQRRRRVRGRRISRSPSSP